MAEGHLAMLFAMRGEAADLVEVADLDFDLIHVVEGVEGVVGHLATHSDER